MESIEGAALTLKGFGVVSDRGLSWDRDMPHEEAREALIQAFDAARDGWLEILDMGRTYGASL